MTDPDRHLAEVPKTLSDLAYECESLVVRDTRLPSALARLLLDAAIGLRAEAERRRRQHSGTQ